ncbi:MAG: hypothetical protein JWP97_4550 [Labilithrix sp.]|nr:hypothetical protein [Labilithrix sp.]
MRVRVAILSSVLGAWLLLAAAACGKQASDPADAAEAGGPELDAAAVAVDAAEAGKGAPIKLGATAQTSVIDGPWWPETGKGTKRQGYLRHGAVVVAYERPTPNDDCKDGWYELVTGGYVCGKAVSADLGSPKVRLAPKQPDHDAGMPYKYGVNLQDGTPLYRKVLATDDRKKYEPWLAPKEEKAEAPSPADEKADKAEAPEGEENPSATPASPAASGTRKKEDDKLDAGVDAAKPKLKSMRGRGVLVRKMARGFYLALDRSFSSSGAKWWRTSFGFAVPFDRIMVQPGVTKYSGSWFEGGAALPGLAGSDAGPGPEGGSDAGVDLAGTVGFVSVGYAHKIEIDEDAKKTSWGPELPKRTAVLLDGKSVTVQGQTYHHTSAGFWVRLADVLLAKPAIPADLRDDEKWIDVDLTRQALVAFEGSRPVFGALISSGRRNPQDKERDFPTPTGTFHIREKHVTTTMDGDVASDGPYSIEDVPWVMYFQGSYALHGAFWHDQFGNKRSHGCVNMAPDDARTLFAWSDPPLPPGWHGVFAKDDAAGTRIVVHEDKPAKR